MRYVLYCLLLLAPLCARAEFLDCVFVNGYENAGTADAAALAALEVHNCARKTVSPAASTPIAPMTWNATAASTAQSWANGCAYGHGGLNGYGQNIYAAASSGPGVTKTLSDAALLWASEEPYYNYSANTCAAGKVCGHYTQMVWSSTTQLGCGLKFCTTGSPWGASFPNWTFVVCDYNPEGNWIGDRPY